MTTPTIQGQRDNLRIGLFLARNQYGTEKDDILRHIGWNGDPRTRNRFESRFDYAQAIGRDARRERRAGYFSWNAQPFGSIFVYKATWYVLRNPQNGLNQPVPLFNSDLRSMRDYRDRYLDTLTSTTRGIRAAHDVQEFRDAEARGDLQGAQNIRSRMFSDGALGELLTGYYGIPYAEIPQILDQLALGNDTSLFRFQRTAQRMLRLQNDLLRSAAQLTEELTRLAQVQGDVPANAQQLALTDADDRLSNL